MGGQALGEGERRPGELDVLRLVEAEQEEIADVRSEASPPIALELLYNVFVAHRDAGNIEPAADALREYLRLIEGIDNRDQLEARLASMDHAVAAQAAATAFTEEDAGPGPSGGAPAPTTPASDDGGIFVPGWIIAGIGVAAVAAGAITGVLALEARTQLERDHGCTAEGVCQPGFESAAADGGLLAGLTDGLLFGGLGVAALGVVLALAIHGGEDTSETARLDLGCDAAGCAASVRGRF